MENPDKIVLSNKEMLQILSWLDLMGVETQGATHVGSKVEVLREVV